MNEDYNGKDDKDNNGDKYGDKDGIDGEDDGKLK